MHCRLPGTLLPLKGGPGAQIGVPWLPLGSLGCPGCSHWRPFGSLWVPFVVLWPSPVIYLGSTRRPGSLKCSQIETPKPGKDPCVCSPLTHGSFSGIVRVPLVPPRLPLGSLYGPLALPCDQYLSSISVVSHTWSRPRAARPKTTRHARKMIELP